MLAAHILSPLIGLTLLAQLPAVLSDGIAASTSDDNKGLNMADIDTPALRLLSDEDRTSLRHIKYHITSEFSEFKSIDEVHSFLDKVKLLVQKHPKNVAFARGELKELHKFLSQEIVTRLIRVDTDTFIMPLSDEKIPWAKLAIEEDELVSKLFLRPYRLYVQARRQAQRSHKESGDHKDGNFFTNFWCKISGSCSNE